MRLLPTLFVALAVPALVAAAEGEGASAGGAERSAEGSPPALSFAYPLFSDTPSPNTTARFDYRLTKRTAGGDALDHQLRLEGEFAPVRWLGLGAMLPYTISDRDDTDNRYNLDDMEVELKLASFVLEEHGILLGGGMAAELPTGSSENEIGSDRLVWLRPFLDAGIRRGPFEATGFLRFALPVNENGRDPDWALSWNSAFLLHAAPIAAVVFELDGERSWGGEEDGEEIVNATPGLRWSPADDPKLWFSTGIRIPVTHDDDFDLRWQISAFYHF